jgi:hypothetical protein
MHEFAIVATCLDRQSLLAIFKNNAIVREPQSLTTLNSIERSRKIDVPAINNTAIFVCDAGISYDDAPIAVGASARSIRPRRLILGLIW